MSKNATIHFSDGIPVLDLAAFELFNGNAPHQLVTQLRYILETIGFYMIVNHGISHEIIELAEQQLIQFFSAKKADKLIIKSNDGSLGYIPPLSTIYKSSTKHINTMADLNETLVIALENLSLQSSIIAQRPFCGPNPWPKDLPLFRGAFINYQQAMLNLAKKILPYYALALDKPHDYFNPAFTHPMVLCRNSHYLPLRPKSNQFGISPHTDHGFFTLLPIPKEPGLEMQTQQGYWIDVKPRKAAILVNTGDFLSRWTNHRFIATPHRVKATLKDRYSMAFFYNPNPDTIADPNDFVQHTKPEKSCKIKPISMHDYLLWYVQKNYINA